MFASKLVHTGPSGRIDVQSDVGRIDVESTEVDSATVRFDGAFA